ncbi:TIGR00730 family Rossman fold protein [uncultured Microscilla sp.]|uniref:LOG family protein n=1 Tax=uncultured Microscilla sp. TaxID=432653 RepID=UPI00263778A6|nr:TIGR00730 family Rossman fold protein [uncultured Microscilla sp.]
MNSICVFCGSRSGANPIYREKATHVGHILAKKGLKLVYGAGKVGLMGAVADAMLAKGGEVIGVIPQFLVDKEVAHDGINELIIVESMHERKQKMTKMADAFLILPGGIGTMEEFFEVYTWGQLGLHQKPIGILNVGSYYDLMIQFLNHTVGQGFMSQSTKDIVFTDTNPEALLRKMRSYKAPDIDKLLNIERT